MLNTSRSRRGMVTSPHHLASQAGLAILRDGGTAIEAAVATAATLAVVYPHMNSIGGDSFWLLHVPGAPPVAIEGCGSAAAAADLDAYRGLGAIPSRGRLAANTVAGTISGWEAALELNRAWGGGLRLGRLLEDAIVYARDGVPVGSGLARTIAAKQAELRGCPGFAEVFLPGGVAPEVGQVLKQPALAATLKTLASDGLGGFYRGVLARVIADDLQSCDTLLSADDLASHRALRRLPLWLDLKIGRLFNFPPPTQGLASLLILAIFERLGVREADGFAHVHGLVEATKRAFAVRDVEVGDPAYMTIDPQALLDDQARLQAWADEISGPAQSWQRAPAGGDTVWFGAIDAQGRAASVIQSTYFEFGSGIVLPQTGIIWQNRGASFRLAEHGWNTLRPRRKPFHTLNPVLAHLRDGRVMLYGTMGGDGQPQTQAAIFSRYALFGQELQRAISAPRWLLGRTWGDASTSLKLERGLGADLAAELAAAGHQVEIVDDHNEMMGHAGALVWHPDCSNGSMIEGAADPRSDGAVAAW